MAYSRYIEKAVEKLLGEENDDPMKMLRKLIHGISHLREGIPPTRHSSRIVKIFYALKVSMKLPERMILHMLPFPEALLNNNFVDKLRNGY